MISGSARGIGIDDNISRLRSLVVANPSM